jgi:enoyl-CoA hydratase
MTDEVVVDRRGAVHVITINRPAARNAIDAAVARGIAGAVDALDDDAEGRVGVLTGAGGTFCAGMDLKAFLRGENPMLEDRGLAGITARPPRKPLIAAVEGWALAGGFELVLACDLVVASRSARFGLPEVTRGLVAGAGGALELVSRVPVSVALEILLTGAPIDAERAYEVGLVNRLTSAGDALAEACGLAELVAANAPLAVEASKRIARSGQQWPSEERWTRQNEIMWRVAASADAREGASAFAEKRSPRWSGS